MKIASFNANGIRARMPLLLQWIEKESPDVLCLQETKAQDTDFPYTPVEALGYHCTVRGEKQVNGVAILSKEQPKNVHYGFQDDREEEATRILEVTIGTMAIVNTYVPQGQDPKSDRFLYKLEWFSRLRQYFDRRFTARDPVIWAGDFNVAPEPIDVYDPEALLGSVGYHPDEHRALATVKDWGFIDLFRRHRPDAREFTFWDYRVRQAPKRGIGWRIDHIWATRCLAEKSKNAWIDAEPRFWERPSDHTFIVAEIDSD